MIFIAVLLIVVILMMAGLDLGEIFYGAFILAGIVAAAAVLFFGVAYLVMIN